MATANEQSDPKLQPNAAKRSDRIVCLVDDDFSIRRSLSRLLESAGFDAVTFGDAEPFLQHVTSNRVPVAVLDIWMEHMTGMELLAHLCSKSPDTRVIFITGHEDPAAEATVMQAGAFGFLIKPVDNEDFLKLVALAFESAAQPIGGRT